MRKCHIFLILGSLMFAIYIYDVYKTKKLLKRFKSLPFYQQKILNNYFLNVPSDFENEKYSEISDLISLFELKNYSELLNETIKEELKFELLNYLQKNPKKDNYYRKIENKIVYVDKSYNFGNSMVLLNNLIYYCEILNISNIYLNANRKWPIVNDLTYNKINIKLETPLNIDFNQKNIFIFDKKLIYFQKVFRTEIRISFLKKEIKKYLPKIKIDENDLYIHIRGGDIFQYNGYKNINYAQPPLCFYISIINNFKFRNIFLLSLDSLNPVIEILNRSFPEIILTNNSFEKDLSLLTNAYNIVGSMSSFLTTSLIINDNLKNFWEYDNYRLSQKYLHLHHDIYKYPKKFTIYKMKSSITYSVNMFPWKNSKKQISLMIKEKCGEFDIIKPS